MIGCVRLWTGQDRNLVTLIGQLEFQMRGRQAFISQPGEILQAENTTGGGRVHVGESV